MQTDVQRWVAYSHAPERAWKLPNYFKPFSEESDPENFREKEITDLITKQWSGYVPGIKKPINDSVMLRSGNKKRKIGGSVGYPAIPPGEIIRHKILKPIGLGPVEAAERVGVSRTYFSNILNGQRDLSLEMALKIEEVFGVLTADELMGYQLACDIAKARNIFPAPV